jgi:hypothetical protein
MIYSFLGRAEKIFPSFFFRTRSGKHQRIRHETVLQMPEKRDTAPVTASRKMVGF